MIQKHSGKTSKTAKNTRPSKNSNTASWLLLVFIASGCMFYLGVMVGRNNAPVHFDLGTMEKKLNNLQQSVLAENTASTRKIENKLNNNMPFDFYNNVKGENPQAPIPKQNKDSRIKRPLFQKPPQSTLVLAKVVGKVTPVPSQPETPPQTATAAAAETTQKPAAVKAPAATQTASQASAAAKPEEQPKGQPAQVAQAVKAPPTSPPVSGGHQYAIQVASLRDSKSADIIRDKFRAKGYPAYVQEAMVEGRGQWYRVRLGPYGERSQAENDLARLQKAGVDAIIFLCDSTANPSASQGKQ